jgi:hypothetical protein
MYKVSSCSRCLYNEILVPGESKFLALSLEPRTSAVVSLQMVDWDTLCLSYSLHCTLPLSQHKICSLCDLWVPSILQVWHSIWILSFQPSMTLNLKCMFSISCVVPMPYPVPQLLSELSKICVLDKVCDVLSLFHYHIAPTNVIYVRTFHTTAQSHTCPRNGI